MTFLIIFVFLCMFIFGVYLHTKDDIQPKNASVAKDFLKVPVEPEAEDLRVLHEKELLHHIENTAKVLWAVARMSGGQIRIPNELLLANRSRYTSRIDYATDEFVITAES